MGLSPQREAAPDIRATRHPSPVGALAQQRDLARFCAALVRGQNLSRKCPKDRQLREGVREFACVLESRCWFRYLPFESDEGRECRRIQRMPSAEGGLRIPQKEPHETISAAELSQ